MKDVAGKTAFVTGGAGGIGLGMVRAFTRAGMNVVIADIDTRALAAAEAELKAAGANVLAVELDVGDRLAWQRVADQAEATFGALHVLCNNAGVTGFDRIIDTPPENWDWILRINLTGVFNGIQAVGRRMLAHGQGGYIVNTSSVAGLYGSKHHAIGAYTASKFGVVGLTERLRDEMEPLGVGVSLLCPGLTLTRIVSNVKKRQPVTSVAGPAATDSASVEQMKRDAATYGMDPDRVGEFVLKCLRERRFYINSHPEFKQLVAARCDALLAGFGESADPSLPLNPNWMATA